MNLFSTSYVGIDIGRYKIDGVRITKNRKKIEISSQFSIPYSKKVFDGEELIDENEIIMALSKIGKMLKVTIEDFLITALFPDKTLFRQIKFSQLPGKSGIMDATKFQIVKELSIPSDSITVDIDVGPKNGDQLDILAFVVRNEDIERLNNFFFKAGLPLPDIIDAGYMKFNYLIEDRLKDGISFLTFEDNTSTYLEFFKDGRFLAIDSTNGGADDLQDKNEVGVKVHYLQISDDIQRLAKMTLSRYSMSNEAIKRVICISEKIDYIDIWAGILKEAGFEEAKSYREFLELGDKILLGAYNLAMRGEIESGETKFLQKKK